MTNLGGHDMESVLEAFESVTSDQPTCFLAYTIKGYGLPFAGHKDNHSGLMSPDDVEAMRASHGVAPGEEWEPLAGLDVAEEDIRRFLARVPFNQRVSRRPSRGGDSGARGGEDRTATHRGHLDPGDVRTRARHDCPRRGTARGPHRDHLPGRDRFHQPRRLGEPAPPLSLQGAGRHVLEGAGRFLPALGGLAEGAARRARDCGAQPVPDARRGGPVAFVVRRAPDPDRDRLRPLHRAWTRRAHLRALPGTPASSSSRLRPGSPWRRRAARISRPPRRCWAWARIHCHRSSLRSRTSCSQSSGGRSNTCSPTTNATPGVGARRTP